MLDSYLSDQDLSAQDLSDGSVIHWLAPHLNLPLAELKKLPLDEQWERIAERAKLAGGIGADEIRRLAEVCKAHLAAFERLRAPALPGTRGAVQRRGQRRAGPALEIALSAAVRGNGPRQSLQHVAQAACRRLGGSPGRLSSGNGRARAGGEEPMKLIFFLLKISWRIALLAALIGALSGAASAGLVALISHALGGANPSSTTLIGLFTALCAVILLTRSCRRCCSAG